MCTGSSGFSFYTLVYKYQRVRGKGKKAQAKKRKMLLLAAALSATSVLGCFLTYFMGRRLVKVISYLPHSGEFEVRVFNLFGFDRVLRAPAPQFQNNQDEMRIDSTSKHKLFLDAKRQKFRYLSTFGTGVWSHRALFQFLIEQQPPAPAQPATVDEGLKGE